MEYKDELINETPVEEVTSDEPVLEETAMEDVEYTPEFSELETATVEDEVVEVPKKKKFPLQTPVIIAACIVAVALIGCILFNLFVPTVEGTWLYQTEDGFSFYYTFDESPKGTECEMSVGTIHFPGTYTLSESDSGKTMNVSVYAGYIYGNYTYEVVGNRLFGHRVLNLVGEDGTAITLEAAKAPKDSDYITPDKDFKEVEEIVGEWEFFYEEYNASLKLTINDDGTLIYDQFGYQELHCVYTADDSKINLSFFETELIAQEEEYYFDNDQLIFLGLNWTRVGDSTPDQA